MTKRPGLRRVATVLLCSLVILLGGTIAGCRETTPRTPGAGAGYAPSQPATFTPTPEPPRLGTFVIPGTGRVLTDSRHRTIYLHDGPKDPRTPHCIGVCTNVWHPVVLAAPTLAPDLPGTGLKVSVLPRPGGLNQLAVDGRRAYTFVDDKGPGDAHGISFITGIGPKGPMVTWGAVQVNAKAPDDLILHPGSPSPAPTPTPSPTNYRRQPART